MRGLGILLSVAVAAVVLWETIATPSLASPAEVERGLEGRPGLTITLYDPVMDAAQVSRTRPRSGAPASSGATGG